MFEETGGLSGSWLGDIADKFLDWKIATTRPDVRWLPTGATGTQVGYGADGTVYQRGQPAPAAAASPLASLLPLLLIAGVVLLLFRVLK